jgi:tRNA(Arg) A34 adenosine deaminase TadA
MARAIELAIKHVKEKRGGPFAAVVVKEGQIIAEGTNRVTSVNDPTAHAEMVAIREACKALNHFQLTGCEIYTTCEPCPMCLGAIYWARPAKVYFATTAADATKAGFDDSFISEQMGLPLSQRRIPMIQLMREDALEAFDRWEKSDKIPY